MRECTKPNDLDIRESLIVSLFLLLTDIDECQDGSHSCHQQATCTDTEGSYSCTCQTGFTGNGSMCTGMYHLQLRKVLFIKTGLFSPYIIDVDHISRGLENTGDYFPSLHIHRGRYGNPWGNSQAGIFEAEGNKSLIPERLAHSPLTCPSTRKVRNESVVSLCSERCNASTGSPWLSCPKWFDRLFSTCNRHLADSPGGKTEDSWANGFRFKSAPLWSLCFFFFLNWGLRKLFLRWNNEENTGCSTCEMYVVKWESSIIHLQIWDNFV